MEEFKCGDMVCLKSHKPVRMTIRWIEENNIGILEACCDWFDGKTLKQSVFPLTSLTTDTNFTSVFVG